MYSLRLRLTLAAALVLLAMAGCTDIREVPDVDLDAFASPDVRETYVSLNACGGYGDLVVDGQIAAPGDACGVCGEGVVGCAGGESLVCLDDPGANDCGGCSALPGRPGRLCGDCELGTWECSDDGEGLLCVGDRAVNACGGCGVLAGVPGADCGSEAEPATFECGGPDELRCVSASANVCGGFDALDGVPGDLCGTCGRGTLACDGLNSVACANADRGVNVCGGCGPIDETPGEPCGACGGTWECSDEGTLVCGRVQNLCGGCATLAGDPGEVCAVGDVDGVWACDTVGVVRCVDASRNLCGGTGTIDGQPGAACGACLDGAIRCLSPERTQCVGSTERNVCGGCGVLPADPGSRCGGNATWVCNDSDLVCSLDLDLNLCGGTASLAAEPGARCGLCETGRFACAGSNQLVCEGATDAESLTWYLDHDGDGFGAAGSDAVVLCAEEPGYARTADDCDDDDDRFHPGADEDPCVDTDDFDCDGVQDYRDDDNDGVSACFDCDDVRRDVRPDAPERCDGRDNNCDGNIDEDAGQPWYRDVDGDGFGDVDDSVVACDPPVGYVDNPRDCDDDDDTRFPGNDERCDDVDNDCDGEIDNDVVDGRPWFRDADGDGFGSPLGTPVVACEAPEGYVDLATDCQDGDDQVFPGADEVCDGRDNDCDGSADVGAVDGTPLFVDLDRDGFGDPTSVVISCPSTGLVANGTDCDDTRRDTYPGARELFADGVDQSCDGREICYLDNDADGFTADFTVVVETTSLSCAGPVACPAGVSPAAGQTQCQLAVGLSPITDCNDGDPSVYPGAGERYGDGIDQDCDGAEICFRDDDEDGWRPSADAVQISVDGDCADFGEALLNEPTGDCWDAPPSAALTLSGSGDAGTWDVVPAQVHPHWAAGQPRAGENVADLAAGISGVDYDCSGATTCYVDTDGDAWRSRDETRVASSVRASDGAVRAFDVCGNAADTFQRFARVEDERCDLPAIPFGTDFAAINPGATEVALDGVDQNCDAIEVCYVDEDGDTYGRLAHTSSSDIDGVFARVQETATAVGLCSGSRRYFEQTFATRDAADPSAAAFNSVLDPTPVQVSSQGGDCGDYDDPASPQYPYDGGSLSAFQIHPFATDVPDVPVAGNGNAIDANCDGRDGHWTSPGPTGTYDIYLNHAGADTSNPANAVCQRAGATVVGGACSFNDAVSVCETSGGCDSLFLTRGNFNTADAGTSPLYARLTSMRVAGGYGGGATYVDRQVTSTSSPTVTSRTRLRPPTDTQLAAAMTTSVGSVEVTGVRIEATDAPTNHSASVGLMVSGSGRVVDVRYSTIVAGDATGTNGRAGDQGVRTGTGPAGGTAGTGGRCTNSGCNGGTFGGNCGSYNCSDPAAVRGGRGGTAYDPDGGSVLGGAGGGVGRASRATGVGVDAVGENGAPGLPGTDGTCSNGGTPNLSNAGRLGLSSTSPGTVWTPSRGDDGRAGRDGSGGGGGGGGGGASYCTCGGQPFEQNDQLRAGNGAPGGAGGRGGFGGGGGFQGGASIALLVTSTGRANLTNVTLVRDDAGDGQPGQRGQFGTSGSGPGTSTSGQTAGADEAGDGGAGGAGGRGADGRGGAGGNGGPSLGIFLASSGQVTQTSVTHQRNCSGGVCAGSPGAGGNSAGSPPAGRPFPAGGCPGSDGVVGEDADCRSADTSNRICP